MSLEVRPGAVFPIDRSLVLTGAPQMLVPQNNNRTHLQFQAPAGGLTYSFTNPLCAGGLIGCYTLAAGATWGPATSVPGTPVYVNGTSGQLLVATEC